MAARAHDKAEKPAHGSSEKHGAKKSHPFRNALLISLALAAVILWQLNPIIHGVHSVETVLIHAEGIRRVAGGLLRTGYDRVATLVGPLIHRVAK